MIPCRRTGRILFPANMSEKLASASRVGAPSLVHATRELGKAGWHWLLDKRVAAGAKLARPRKKSWKTAHKTEYMPLTDVRLYSLRCSFCAAAVL